MEQLRTSEQWYNRIPKKYKFTILDPDGWDRKNYDYSFYRERITFNEFMSRVMYSTCELNRDILDVTPESLLRKMTSISSHQQLRKYIVEEIKEKAKIDFPLNHITTSTSTIGGYSRKVKVTYIHPVDKCLTSYMMDNSLSYLKYEDIEEVVDSIIKAH